MPKFNPIPMVQRVRTNWPFWLYLSHKAFRKTIWWRKVDQKLPINSPSNSFPIIAELLCYFQNYHRSRRHSSRTQSMNWKTQRGSTTFWTSTKHTGVVINRKQYVYSDRMTSLQSCKNWFDTQIFANKKPSILTTLHCYRSEHSYPTLYLCVSRHLLDQIRKIHPVSRPFLYQNHW